MKLMLCGKGGCGKSTISTLLAKEFSRQGKKVLVVDCDESNYGLYRQLGMELPKDFTEYFGGKSSILDSLMSGFGFSPFEDKWKLDDIPAEYVSENGNIKLIVSGKIKQAGEGCACAMGAVSQQLNVNLDLADDEVMIMDMEAGVEHFGRGVNGSVDAVLAIIDPSFESLELYKKITSMGESINKPVYYILNKVNDDNKVFINDMIENKANIIGIIPVSNDIAIPGLKGEELDVKSAEVEKICNKLVESINA